MSEARPQVRRSSSRRVLPPSVGFIFEVRQPDSRSAAHRLLGGFTLGPQRRRLLRSRLRAKLTFEVRPSPRRSFRQLVGFMSEARPPVPPSPRFRLLRRSEGSTFGARRAGSRSESVPLSVASVFGERLHRSRLASPRQWAEFMSEAWQPVLPHRRCRPLKPSAELTSDPERPGSRSAWVRPVAGLTFEARPVASSVASPRPSAGLTYGERQPASRSDWDLLEAGLTFEVPLAALLHRWCPSLRRMVGFMSGRSLSGVFTWSSSPTGMRPRRLGWREERQCCRGSRVASFCLVCGVVTRGSRCAEHRIPHRTSAEQRRRSEVVAAWVGEYGWLCPGWQRPPHPRRDLTADHVVPRSMGGEDGELRVLCRSCNSSRGVGVGGRESIENAG
jgi:5-methylcytosine-specific restriction endonuclease McrA